METASIYNSILMTSAVGQIQQKCSNCMALILHYSGAYPIKYEEETKIESEEYNIDRFIGYQKDQFQHVLNELHQSNFYYKGMSKEQATNLLIDKGPGHFLIRESKSVDNYFTLTFKNQKNEVKNTRIQYSFGLFYFSMSAKKSSSPVQEDQPMSPHSPTLFMNSKGKQETPKEDSVLKADSVIKLIELYVKKCKETNKSVKKIFLLTPIKHTISSLKHMCRVCVNEETVDTHVLPRILKDYVKNYPYKV
eukprot:TCONS_00064610-protein